MTMPDIPQVDDVYLRLKQIPIKYFNKSNFQIYLKTLSEEIKQVRQMFYDLRYKRTLYEAEGKNLDNIGEIVVEPRSYNVDLDVGFFAFSGNIYASGFDEGFWFDGNNITSNGNMEDSQYLKSIQSKIFKNNGNATWEDIIKISKTLLNTNEITIEPSYPAGLKIYYNIDLTDVEKQFYGEYIQSCLGAGIKLVDFNHI